MASDADTLDHAISITKGEGEDRYLTSGQLDRTLIECFPEEVKKLERLNQSLEAVGIPSQINKTNAESNIGVEITDNVVSSNIETTERQNHLPSYSLSEVVSQEKSMSDYSPADVPNGTAIQILQDEKQLQKGYQLETEDKNESEKNKDMEDAAEYVVVTSSPIENAEEPSLEVGGEETSKDNKIHNQNIEVLDQLVSVNDDPQNGQTETNEPEEVKKEEPQEDKDNDFTSSKQVPSRPDTPEATLEKNTEASTHNPELTVKEGNNDVETLIEAIKEENTSNTPSSNEIAHSEDPGETELREDKGDKSIDLVGEEQSREAVRSGEQEIIENKWKEQSINDDRDASDSTILVSPEIQIDEATCEIGDIAKDKLEMPPINVETEQGAELEVGEKPDGSSSVACEDNGHDIIKSGKQEKDATLAKDEIQDKSNDSPTLAQAEEISGGDNDDIVDSENGSESLVRGNPEEAQCQTETRDKNAIASSIQSEEGKHGEFSEQTLNSTLIELKDDLLSSGEEQEIARSGVFKNKEAEELTIILADDNINSTQIGGAVEHIKDEQDPEILLQQNEPGDENTKNPRKESPEESDSSASREVETTACSREERSITNSEKSAAHDVCKDDVPNEKILAEDSLDHPESAQVSGLFLEGTGQEKDQVDQVSRCEPKELIEQSDSESRNDEKHNENESEAHKSTETVTTEQAPLDGTVTEMISETSESIVKIEKVHGSDLDEKLEIKDSGVDIAEELEDNEANIKTQGDENEHTLEDDSIIKAYESEQSLQVESLKEAETKFSEVESRSENDVERGTIIDDEAYVRPTSISTGEIKKEQLREGSNDTSFPPKSIEVEVLNSFQGSEKEADMLREEESSRNILNEGDEECIREDATKNDQDDKRDTEKSKEEDERTPQKDDVLAPKEVSTEEDKDDHTSFAKKAGAETGITTIEADEMDEEVKLVSEEDSEKAMQKEGSREKLDQLQESRDTEAEEFCDNARKITFATKKDSEQILQKNETTEKLEQLSVTNMIDTESSSENVEEITQKEEASEHVLQTDESNETLEQLVVAREVEVEAFCDSSEILSRMEGEVTSQNPMETSDQGIKEVEVVNNFQGSEKEADMLREEESSGKILNEGDEECIREDATKNDQDDKRDTEKYKEEKTSKKITVFPLKKKQDVKPPEKVVDTLLVKQDESTPQKDDVLAPKEVSTEEDKDDHTSFAKKAGAETGITTIEADEMDEEVKLVSEEDSEKAMQKEGSREKLDQLQESRDTEAEAFCDNARKITFATKKDSEQILQKNETTEKLEQLPVTHMIDTESSENVEDITLKEEASEHVLQTDESNEKLEQLVVAREVEAEAFCDSSESFSRIEGEVTSQNLMETSYRGIKEVEVINNFHGSEKEADMLREEESSRKILNEGDEESIREDAIKNYQDDKRDTEKSKEEDESTPQKDDVLAPKEVSTEEDKDDHTSFAKKAGAETGITIIEADEMGEEVKLVSEEDSEKAMQKEGSREKLDQLQESRDTEAEAFCDNDREITLATKKDSEQILQKNETTEKLEQLSVTNMIDTESSSENVEEMTLKEEASEHVLQRAESNEKLEQLVVAREVEKEAFCDSSESFSQIEGELTSQNLIETSDQGIKEEETTGNVAEKETATEEVIETASEGQQFSKQISDENDSMTCQSQESGDKETVEENSKKDQICEALELEASCSNIGNDNLEEIANAGPPSPCSVEDTDKGSSENENNDAEKLKESKLVSEERKLKVSMDGAELLKDNSALRTTEAVDEVRQKEESTENLTQNSSSAYEVSQKEVKEEILEKEQPANNSDSFPATIEIEERCLNEEEPQSKEHLKSFNHITEEEATSLGVQVGEYEKEFDSVKATLDYTSGDLLTIPSKEHEAKASVESKEPVNTSVRDNTPDKSEEIPLIEPATVRKSVKEEEKPTIREDQSEMGSSDIGKECALSEVQEQREEESDMPHESNSYESTSESNDAGTLKTEDPIDLENLKHTDEVLDTLPVVSADISTSESEDAGTSKNEDTSNLANECNSCNLEAKEDGKPINEALECITVSTRRENEEAILKQEDSDKQFEEGLAGNAIEESATVAEEKSENEEHDDAKIKYNETSTEEVIETTGKETREQAPKENETVQIFSLELTNKEIVEENFKENQVYKGSETGDPSTDTEKQNTKDQASDLIPLSIVKEERVTETSKDKKEVTELHAQVKGRSFEFEEQTEATDTEKIYFRNIEDSSKTENEPAALTTMEILEGDTSTKEGNDSLSGSLVSEVPDKEIKEETVSKDELSTDDSNSALANFESEESGLKEAELKDKEILSGSLVSRMPDKETIEETRSKDELSTDDSYSALVKLESEESGLKEAELEDKELQTKGTILDPSAIDIKPEEISTSKEKFENDLTTANECGDNKEQKQIPIEVEKDSIVSLDATPQNEVQESLAVKSEKDQLIKSEVAAVVDETPVTVRAATVYEYSEDEAAFTARTTEEKFNHSAADSCTEEGNTSLVTSSVSGVHDKVIKEEMLRKDEVTIDDANNLANLSEESGLKVAESEDEVVKSKETSLDPSDIKIKPEDKSMSKEEDKDHETVADVSGENREKETNEVLTRGVINETDLTMPLDVILKDKLQDSLAIPLGDQLKTFEAAEIIDETPVKGETPYGDSEAESPITAQRSEETSATDICKKEGNNSLVASFVSEVPDNEIIEAIIQKDELSTADCNSAFDKLENEKSNLKTAESEDEDIRMIGTTLDPSSIETEPDKICTSEEKEDLTVPLDAKLSDNLQDSLVETTEVHQLAPFEATEIVDETSVSGEASSGYSEAGASPPAQMAEENRLENPKDVSIVEYSAKQNTNAEFQGNDERLSVAVEVKSINDKFGPEDAVSNIKTSADLADQVKVLENENLILEQEDAENNSKDNFIGAEEEKAAMVLEEVDHGHNQEATISVDDNLKREEDLESADFNEMLKCASDQVAEDQNDETFDRCQTEEIYKHDQDKNFISVEQKSLELPLGEDAEKRNIKMEEEKDEKMHDGIRNSGVTRNIEEKTIEEESNFQGEKVGDGIRNLDVSENLEEKVIEEESNFKELHMVSTPNAADELAHSGTVSREYIEVKSNEKAETVNSELQEDSTGEKETTTKEETLPHEWSEKNANIPISIAESLEEDVRGKVVNDYVKTDTTAAEEKVPEPASGKAPKDDVPLEAFASSPKSLELIKDEYSKFNSIKPDDATSELVFQLQHHENAEETTDNPTADSVVETKPSSIIVSENKIQGLKEIDDSELRPTIEKEDANEIQESSQLAAKSTLLEVESVPKGNNSAEQIPSSASSSNEHKHETLIIDDKTEENRMEVEVEVQAHDSLQVQNEATELKVSEMGLVINKDMQPDDLKELHEEGKTSHGDLKLEAFDRNDTEVADSPSESEKIIQKAIETSANAIEYVPEVHIQDIPSKSEDSMKNEENKFETPIEGNTTVKNKLPDEEVLEEKEIARTFNVVLLSEETNRESTVEKTNEVFQTIRDEDYHEEIRQSEVIEKGDVSESTEKQIRDEDGTVDDERSKERFPDEVQGKDAKGAEIRVNLEDQDGNKSYGNETKEVITQVGKESGIEILQPEGPVASADSHNVTVIHKIEEIDHEKSEVKPRQREAHAAESSRSRSKDSDAVPIAFCGPFSEPPSENEGQERSPEGTEGPDIEIKESALGEEKTCESGEKKPEEPISTDVDNVSLAKLMQSSGKETPQVGENVAEAAKQMINDEELQNEEAECAHGEDAEAHEEKGSENDDREAGSDAPVIVEASKDIDVKVSHKKSHNILSGVGSKVKHSISKVKKAITGKSSHQKTQSPK